MKTNEVLLQEYYGDIVLIDSAIHTNYANMLRKAIFVINTKLNNGDNSIIDGMRFITNVVPELPNGICITNNKENIEKEMVVDAISAFFRQNTGLELIEVSINRKDKRTVIVTPDFNLRDFWKSLCGLLPMLAPWCLSFEGKDKDDIDFVKQYLSNSFENNQTSENNAERMFAALFEDSGIRSEFTKRELEKFSKTFLATERSHLLNRLNEINNEQERMISHFEEMNTKKLEIQIKIAGIEANNDRHEKVVRDITFIIDTTDGLSLVDINDDTLYFDYITPMEIWQRDDFESHIKNTESYLYTRILSVVDVKISTIEKFWRRIFDTCEYKVMFMTMFSLNFKTAILRNTARNDRSLYKVAERYHCMFNPHISPDMTCMEQYSVQVAQCMSEGLYDDALGSMCMAAKSFSIPDTVIGGIFVQNCLTAPCIKTPDGIFTGVDILQAIEDEEEGKEE